MNKTLIQEFYTDNEFKTFHGFHLLSIDGSRIQLPPSGDLINHYGANSNQYGAAIPMAQASTIFDVLNKVTVNGIIAPYKTSERSLATELIQNLLEIDTETDFKEGKIRDLFILDRGYPSIPLIKMFYENKKDFLMRCPANFVKDVNIAIKSGKKDQIVCISLSNLNPKTKRKLKQNIPNFDQNEIFKVRILLFKLKSGEQEILLTSLLDKNEYSSNELFDLYRRRWEIEESYKFHKSIAAVENFSGKSKLTVEQDFLAAIFTCNIATLLMEEAQDEINEILEQKKLKYKYKVNRNIGLGLLKDELIETILSNKDISEFCAKVKLQMQKYLVPIRPGRSFPPQKSRWRNHSINRRSGI